MYGSVYVGGSGRPMTLKAPIKRHPMGKSGGPHSMFFFFARDT